MQTYLYLQIHLNTLLYVVNVFMRKYAHAWFKYLHNQYSLWTQLFFKIHIIQWGSAKLASSKVFSTWIFVRWIHGLVFSPPLEYRSAIGTGHLNSEPFELWLVKVHYSDVTEFQMSAIQIPTVVWFLLLTAVCGIACQLNLLASLGFVKYIFSH